MNPLAPSSNTRRGAESWPGFRCGSSVTVRPSKTHAAWHMVCIVADRDDDPGTHRHLGVALRAMARRVLSAGLARARRARICGGTISDDRAQRQLLFAAKARVLRALVSAGAR